MLKLKNKNTTEEEPLCRHCYSRTARTRAIQDYCYKPAPIVYGEETRYFGVELVIGGAGECGGNTQEILNLANACSELVYYKHDGSLDERVGIVTHPMTLAFHQERMPWKAVLDEAVSMGYRRQSPG